MHYAGTSKVSSRGTLLFDSLLLELPLLQNIVERISGIDEGSSVATTGQLGNIKLVELSIRQLDNAVDALVRSVRNDTDKLIAVVENGKAQYVRKNDLPVPLAVVIVTIPDEIGLWAE